jgi:hypothetical protein
MPFGYKIIICGDKDKDIFSEFDLYAIDKNGLASKPLVSGGALENFKINASNERITIHELFGTTDTQHDSGVIYFISCDKDSCKLSEEKCILQHSKSNYPNAIPKMKTYLNSNTKEYFSESLISELVDLAFSGNKEAQEFFLNSQKNLKIDGSNAEYYESTKYWLKKFIKLGCL